MVKVFANTLLSSIGLGNNIDVLNKQNGVNLSGRIRIIVKTAML